ncbi:FG-GAP repeat domain-containing protein [Archangium lipolyticum]|uniref:FG-GAP repeat domain-containing protein n=1 Tax=Archangium lipolyticum TaxID=2970465 RepID=UPI002149E6AD|nr:VCBS repeat-containing protein [Archangium lipolyticum]
MLVLASGCEEEGGRLPDDYVGPSNPLPPGKADQKDGGTPLKDGGVVLSDGGLLDGKPTCEAGSTSCAGACSDGGIICAGNCGFLAPVTYRLSSSSGPKNIAPGDINRDGYDDLVTSSGTTDSVSLLLNRQNGFFQTPTVMTTGKTPSALALADLDADQRLDLAVANNGDSSLWVYRGDGAGGFQRMGSFPARQDITDMVVGPFSATGQGIALVHNAYDKVSVYGVNGDATLGAKAEYAAPTGPKSAAVADFNRDGKLDIAVTHSANCGSENVCKSVGVLLNKGDGTFQDQLFVPVGDYPAHALEVTDLNLDLIPDLVVTTEGGFGGEVSALLGRGDGTFHNKTRPGPAVGNGANWMTLADINRDGVQDVLVAFGGDNRLGLYLGRSDGSLAWPPVSLYPQPQGGWLQGLTASDFDKDGFKDVAVLTGTGVQMLWGICR